MFCENCGKDSNTGIIYKGYIFCSVNCRDGYYKAKNQDKKRLKIWLKQKRELNKTENYNRTSHYSRDVCH